MARRPTERGARGSRRSGWLRGAVLVVFLGLVGFGVLERLDLPSQAPAADGEEAVARGFEQRRSGFMAEVSGEVVRLLTDDEEGSRHQRFILRLSSGQTLLVAHNLDLAERAPVSPGMRVAVRGEYEWNARGGVLHWTHHDPSGRRPGGWIRVGDATYR